jgi:lysophospholipase L1-like esterase
MSAVYDVNGNVVIRDGGDESIAKENLTGKVLITIGDSYTVGMRSYYTAMATKYGMILDSRGVGGSSISNADGTSNPMCFRVDTIIENYTSGYEISGTTYYKDDVAVIVFMGGTNDPIANVALGTGINDTSTATVYGALNHIFNSLQKEFTKTTIIAVSQPANYALDVQEIVISDQRAINIGFDSMAQALAMDNVQFTAFTMARKEGAVIELAKQYGVNLIDMFHNMPSIFNPTNRSVYWRGDKLHLSETGYKLVADTIEKRIVDLFGIS